MRIKSKLLSIAFASAVLPFIFVNSAQASGTCTVRTAKQSVSSNTLCACDVVTSGMLRYIQRRADFESILERTILDCPRFAAVLTDLPTASVGANEQRSGDGPSDETNQSNGFDRGDRDPEPNKPDPEPNKPDPEPSKPEPTKDTDDGPKGGGGPGSQTGNPSGPGSNSGNT